MSFFKKAIYALIIVNSLLFAAFATGTINAAEITGKIYPSTAKDTAPKSTNTTKIPKSTAKDTTPKSTPIHPSTAKDTTPVLVEPKIRESNVNPPKDCLKDNGAGVLVPCSEPVFTPSITTIPTSLNVPKDCLKEVDGSGVKVPCGEAVVQPTVPAVETNTAPQPKECFKEIDSSGVTVPCNEPVVQPTMTEVPTSAGPPRECQKEIDDSGVTELCSDANNTTNNNLPKTGAMAETLPVTGAEVSDNNLLVIFDRIIRFYIYSKKEKF
jgi:hypothetical protein